jgi:hypothetical protein
MLDPWPYGILLMPVRAIVVAKLAVSATGAPPVLDAEGQAINWRSGRWLVALALVLVVWMYKTPYGMKFIHGIFPSSQCGS